MKADLAGNILWAASIADIHTVDGVQFIDGRIILQLELFDFSYNAI